MAIELTPKLIRQRFQDAKVYLFGSYAKGEWIEDSDIDIIVVSEEFQSMSWADRIGEIRRLLPKDVGYEILAYTPSEFEKAKKSSVVVSDASEYWIGL